MCEGFHPACATPTGNNVLTISSDLCNLRDGHQVGIWGQLFLKILPDSFLIHHFVVQPSHDWGRRNLVLGKVFVPATGRRVISRLRFPVAQVDGHIRFGNLVGLCLFPAVHEWDKATVQQIQCGPSADVASFSKLTAAHGVGIRGQCLRNFFI